MDITKFSKEQLHYCDSICEVGYREKERLLRECESACDAAFDMWDFVKQCSEHCNKLKDWDNTNARNN